MIPQISSEELEAAGLTTGWIVMILLVLGSLVAGFLTQAVKVAVVGSYERGGKPEPAWCHALWTLLPFGLGSLVVAGGSLVVGLHVFWGISLGLVAGGSSSGAVRWYKRLTNKAGLAAERRLAAEPAAEPAAETIETGGDL